MKKLAKSIFDRLQSHPFSLGAFVITTLPWTMVYMAQRNIKLNPAPQNHIDFRGEGLMFSVIFAIGLAIIMMIITALNLVFQKDRGFYIELLITISFLNLLLYWIL